MSSGREYVALAPHFRQALGNPLEQSARTALLDRLSASWLDWPAGDYRWGTLAALVAILERRDVDAADSAWADAVSRLIDAISDASPTAADEVRHAIDQLAGAAVVVHSFRDEA